jgi:hypothetical protein
VGYYFMSMNLYCEEVDLLQTPTHITYMCFSNNDGGSEGIKYRYLKWVESHLNGIYANEHEMTIMQWPIKNHIKEINACKKLTFSIM